MKSSIFKSSKILLIILSLCITSSTQAQEKVFTKRQIRANESKQKKIIKDLLESFTLGANEVLKLFHKDAIIEYPYANSLETPSKLNKQDYGVYLKSALENMPHLEFSNVQIYTSHTNIFWAEFHGELTVPKNTKRYKQDYAIRITVKDGKIHNYKEYWNPIAALIFGGKEEVKEIFNKNLKN